MLEELGFSPDYNGFRRDEGSKIFYKLIKNKLVTNRVFGVHQPNGSLEEDPNEIKCMFGLHFRRRKNLLVLYHIWLWLLGAYITKWSCTNSSLEGVIN